MMLRAACSMIVVGAVLLSAPPSSATRAVAAAEPQPLNLTAWHNKRLLVIGAHPDDAEGFAGGLIAELQRLRDSGGANVTVSYLVVTNGNAGGKCYNASGHYRPATYACENEELAFLRRQEMKAAGASLGVNDVRRLGLDDGLSLGVQETRIRRALTAVVRSVKPHIILTHQPFPNFAAPPTCNGACPAPHNFDDLGYHPDHQAIGLHVFNSAYGGGAAIDNDRLFEDLEPELPGWKDLEQLYFFAVTQSSFQPLTHFVQLNDGLLKSKAYASSLHRSQYADLPLAQQRFVAEQAGEAAGVPLAEGFTAWF